MSSIFQEIYGDTKQPTLGRNVESSTRVRLFDPERSTYIIGAQGTGKSTLLNNLIISDIELNDKGIVVFDVHGDLAHSIVRKCPPEHAHRVIYFAPVEQKEQVLGFNPFELQSLNDLELKAGALMQVFAHSWYGQFSHAPTMQTTLETLIRTLLYSYQSHETNFLHMLLLTQLTAEGKKWRQKLSPFVKHNPALMQNWKEWEKETRLKADIESTRQKVKHIISSDILVPILCQPKSSACFRFQDVLSNKGIFIVNLAGLEDENQRLVGSLILSQLLVMAKKRKSESERVPCHIYADEYYKLSPESFVDVINEMRKFRLFCTLAHQNLAQLNKVSLAAASNCENVIVFRVNPKDSGTLRKHFGATGKEPATTHLANLPTFHAMVRYRHGLKRKQALIKTLPEKGVDNPDVARTIWQQSKAYGRPKEAILQYIDDILEAIDEDAQTAGKPPLREKRQTARN